MPPRARGPTTPRQRPARGGGRPIATIVYNRARLRALDGSLAWDSVGTSFGVLLFNDSQAIVGAGDPDLDTVAQVIANGAGADLAECVGTGYSRKTVTGRTLTLDDSTDKVVAAASNVSWPGADFGTVQRALVFQITGSDINDDATNIPVALVDSGQFPLATNSGSFALAFSNGVFYAD
jgi:hypothetical protein